MKTVVKFFRDQIWQFISVIVGIVALLWTIQIYTQDKPIYDLQVVILSNSSLVRITTGFTNQIHIMYENRVAENLSLVDIKIENSGNQPIPSSSYEQPISFTFPEGSEIIKASI